MIVFGIVFVGLIATGTNVFVSFGLAVVCVIVNSQQEHEHRVSYAATRRREDNLRKQGYLKD